MARSRKSKRKKIEPVPPNGGGGNGKTEPPTEPTTNTDVFGTAKIYPDKVGGNQWDSKKLASTKHEIKTIRDIKKEWQDTVDPLVWVPAVGDAHLVFPGDGTWIAKGKSPRVTVLKSWGSGVNCGVEVTVFVKPLKGADNIDLRAKTDHYCIPDCSPNCFGGYTCTFYWKDGDSSRITYKKEQTHELGYSSRMGTERFDLFPQDKYIVVKHVVYNLPNGHVKMESYVDTTGTGKSFKKMTEETDDNTKRWGIGDNDTVYAPYTKATKGSAIRCNSLDTKDGGTDYAEYQFKNWTIREISV